MAKSIVFDEIHVTFRVPQELPEDQSEGLHRTLTGKEFMARLQRAVRSVVRADPTLAIVRVGLSR